MEISPEDYEKAKFLAKLCAPNLEVVSATISSSEKLLLLQNGPGSKSDPHLSVLNLLDSSINSLLSSITSYMMFNPDLKELVPNPLLFVKTVKVVLSWASPEIDPLHQLHNPQLALQILLSCINCDFTLLSEEDKMTALRQTELFIFLSNLRDKVIKELSDYARQIAPNLTALNGPEIAINMIFRAGSIEGLARMPACNIQVIGNMKEANQGLSKQAHSGHLGLFAGHVLMQQVTEAKARPKLARLLSNATGKVARIDSCGAYKSGEKGAEFLKKVEQDLVKFLEPKKKEDAPPLPVPNDGPKIRRGGRRFRKLKEKIGLTQMGKLRNTVAFGTDFSEEVINQTEGLGMLTQNKVGIMRLKRKIEKKIFKEKTKGSKPKK